MKKSNGSVSQDTDLQLMIATKLQLHLDVIMVYSYHREFFFFWIELQEVIQYRFKCPFKIFSVGIHKV